MEPSSPFLEFDRYVADNQIAFADALQTFEEWILGHQVLGYEVQVLTDPE